MCNMCDKVLRTSSGLYRHKLATHNALPKFAAHAPPLHACNSCGYTTRFKCSLTRHELRHSGVRPFVCGAPGCTYAATSTSNLNTHRERHKPKEERRFQCGNAGCVFVSCTKKSMIKHLAKCPQK